MTIEKLLLISSFLVLLSILIARYSQNLGVPSLVLFLGLGMLAGSHGPGGIQFHDAEIARSVGIFALILILFSGGLDTDWRGVKPQMKRALSLATLGVLVTAMVVAAFATFVLGFSLQMGLLLGAIISSTDAAAVFSVMRTRNVHLRKGLKPLLELESGSNDPMAVFLTVGLITMIQRPEAGWAFLPLMLLQQMGIGALAGVLMGRLVVHLTNKLRFPFEGLYSVFSLAWACFTFGVTDFLGGSGFLAVYLTAIILGNSRIVHKRLQLRFFDGLAWLAQIGMFLTLGLLVNPPELIPVASLGLMISAVLIFLARPLAVLISLSFTRLRFREKLFISWVGLRGAVPIILATFPLLAGISEAGTIFNMVFFIVITSALLQGWSIPFVARLLRVDSVPERTYLSPFRFALESESEAELVDMMLPFRSVLVGKAVVDIDLPPETLIIVVCRNGQFMVPSGGTLLEEGDTLLVLVTADQLPNLRAILQEIRPVEEPHAKIALEKEPEKAGREGGST